MVERILRIPRRRHRRYGLSAECTTTEAELAAEAKAYFERDGYECWAEVRHIDLVARKDGVPLGIEVKKQFNPHLVAQALQAQSYCGAAFMVIPRVADVATKYCVEAVVEKSGLGCLEIWDWGYATPTTPRFEAKLLAAPTRRLHDGTDAIKKLLVPETKNWTEAGKPSCRAVTDFRLTALRIRNYVQDHVGCTVQEVLAEVPVHWRKSGAKSNLLKMLDKGAIDGVVAVARDGMETTLVPA